MRRVALAVAALFVSASLAYADDIRAAMEKGCTVQVGTDMLFEQIPAYLEFFGFGTSSLSSEAI